MNKFISIFFTVIIFSSCSTNAGTGLFAGGAVGGGAGLIAGGGSFTLLGMAAGMVSGGLVGAIVDQQDRKILEQSSPRTLGRIDKGEPLTLNDLIKLSQSGVSDDAIIQYLRAIKSAYSLTQTQVRRLRDAGVSERVIQFISEPS
ncbi:MAG: hypothetical protein FJZ64_01405 [Chlamydiae bacterium]|nr:hypothetical protein [Chlamydiota bacterium]